MRLCGRWRERSVPLSVVGDVLEWTGQGFDLIVDYAGYGTTTAGALKAIRKNGRVVVVGMARMQITLDTMDIIHKQAQLLGSSGGTKDDVAAIYDLLASGDVTPVVNVIGFDDIPAGLDDLQHHRLAGGWSRASANEGQPDVRRAGVPDRPPETGTGIDCGDSDDERHGEERKHRHQADARTRRDEHLRRGDGQPRQGEGRDAVTMIGSFAQDLTRGPHRPRGCGDRGSHGVSPERDG